MSDFLRTKAGLQVVETITRMLPRITNALEEIAKSLNTLANDKMYEVEERLYSSTEYLKEIALGLNYLRRLENDERKKEALDNRMKKVMIIKGDNNGKEKQEDVWSSHENANR